jgi:hypothetical protein
MQQSGRGADPQEAVALLALHLAVLHGRAAQGVVQLGGEEGVGAGLVLRQAA